MNWTAIRVCPSFFIKIHDFYAIDIDISFLVILLNARQSWLFLVQVSFHVISPLNYSRISIYKTQESKKLNDINPGKLTLVSYKQLNNRGIFSFYSFQYRIKKKRFQKASSESR